MLEAAINAITTTAATAVDAAHRRVRARNSRRAKAQFKPEMPSPDARPRLSAIRVRSKGIGVTTLSVANAAASETTTAMIRRIIAVVVSVKNIEPAVPTHVEGCAAIIAVRGKLQESCRDKDNDMIE